MAGAGGPEAAAAGRQQRWGLTPPRPASSSSSPARHAPCGPSLGSAEGPQAPALKQTCCCGAWQGPGSAALGPVGRDAGTRPHLEHRQALPSTAHRLEMAMRSLGTPTPHVECPRNSASCEHTWGDLPWVAGFWLHPGPKPLVVNLPCHNTHPESTRGGRGEAAQNSTSHGPTHSTEAEAVHPTRTPHGPAHSTEAEAGTQNTARGCGPSVGGQLGHRPCVPPRWPRSGGSTPVLLTAVG